MIMPSHTQKDNQMRAWCRERYGAKWHANKMNKPRMKEAKAALFPPKRRGVQKLMDKLQAWCKDKYGPGWDSGGYEDERMIEALRNLSPTPPPDAPEPPDVMLVWSQDGLLCEEPPDNPPNWMESVRGQLAGYHAVDIPSPKMRRDQNVTLYGTNQRYTHADFVEDFAVLRSAKSITELSKMRSLECNNPLSPRTIDRAKPPPFKICEFVTHMRDYHDSRFPGHRVLWPDAVPEGTNVGDCLSLPGGGTGVVLDSCMYDIIVPSILPTLPLRLSYAPSPPAVV